MKMIKKEARNNKNIKKVLILLSLMMCVFTIYEIVRTYAVFYSEVSGVGQMNIAKWNIEVNGTDITTGTTTEFIIDQFSFDENVNVKEGKLAPGTRGSFYILIKPKDTQVSVRYDISIDKFDITNNKIKLVSIEKENAEILTMTDENTYTGIIDLVDIKNDYSENIKIIFEWENSESNNIADTEIGKTINSKLQVPVTVHLSQYLGESINP